MNGRIAQLVRAPALQAGGPKFESWYAHHSFLSLLYFDQLKKLVIIDKWTYQLKS
jgi:hypothetical protein